MLDRALEDYYGAYGELSDEEFILRCKGEVIADLYGDMKKRGFTAREDIKKTVHELVDGPRWDAPDVRRGGEEAYSVKRTKEMSLEEQLKDYYAGALKSSDAFYFGETPGKLKLAGLDELPLVMSQEDFKKSTKEKHNTPRRVLKAVQQDLSDALFAFKVGEKIGVLTNDIDGDGKPLLIGIQANKEMDRKPVNAIKSIYGLDHVKEWIENQIKKGDFILLNKERANTFLQAYGYKASAEEGIRSIEENVAQQEETVKENFSIAEDDVKQQDSEGRELSAQQQEFFSDSKVRNKNGFLRPVFHYTNERFTQFEQMPASKQSRKTLGDGFYVSTNLREFEDFGKYQMEMYANITNPFEKEMSEDEANKVYDKYFVHKK